MDLLKQMKKANFNILISGENEAEALAVKGYIFKYKDLCFGVNKANDGQGCADREKWIITELQTGMRCNATKLLKDITSEFLDSFYNNVIAVIKHLKTHFKSKKYNFVSYFNYYYIIAQNMGTIEKLEKTPDAEAQEG